MKSISTKRLALVVAVIVGLLTVAYVALDWALQGPPPNPFERRVTITLATSHGRHIMFRTVKFGSDDGTDCADSTNGGCHNHPRGLTAKLDSRDSFQIPVSYLQRRNSVYSPVDAKGLSWDLYARFDADGQVLRADRPGRVIISR
jgi:hypothetical protein